MGSRSRRWRSSPGNIEQDLRTGRPEAREDFVAALSGTVRGPSRLRWARPAAAIALLCVGLAALGAFGGIGYAASAVSKTVSSATDTLSLSTKPPSVDTGSPAHDQYGGGFGGCTPGYWKQSQHFFRWGSIPQTRSFNATFTVTPAQSGFANSFSLLDALKNGGGGIAALGRQGTAAYLNSQTPGMNFPYTSVQVV